MHAFSISHGAEDELSDHLFRTHDLASTRDTSVRARLQSCRRSAEDDNSLRRRPARSEAERAKENRSKANIPPGDLPTLPPTTAR